MDQKVLFRLHVHPNQKFQNFYNNIGEWKSLSVYFRKYSLSYLKLLLHYWKFASLINYWFSHNFLQVFADQQQSLVHCS